MFRLTAGITAGFLVVRICITVRMRITKPVRTCIAAVFKPEPDSAALLQPSTNKAAPAAVAKL